MYLPKTHFFGGLEVRALATGPRARTTSHQRIVADTGSADTQLAQARTFNTRIGSHAIKQCIFKGPKLGRKIFNFLASIPLDLAGIIDF